MANSPAFTQLETFNKKVSEYFKAISDATVNNSALPDPKEFFEDIEYTDILTMALLGQKGGVNAHVGAAIDTVHSIEALFREHDYAMKNKRRIYEDSISDCAIEASFYTEQGQRLGSMIDGVGVV